jgi:tRNA-splicing ligase RtcB
MQEQGKISDLMKVLGLGSLYHFRSRSFQFRKNIRRNQNANAARLARGARDEPPSFKSEDHLMNGRRRDIEVTLHISLGRRTLMNLGVVMDEGEVLTLLARERICHKQAFYPNTKAPRQPCATRLSNPFAIMASGTENTLQQALNNNIMAIPIEKLEKIDDYRWMIPRSTKPGMLTDALIYTDESMLRDLAKDLSLEQAVNVAMLPGIVGRSMAMPDVHQGYGFPIGGVAATDPAEGGVISPGGVGFDINCGVRLLGSSLQLEETRPRIRDLVNQLFRDVPCGAGREGEIQISYSDLDQVLNHGAAWMVQRNYGDPDDLIRCEENGAMDGADPEAVSDRAKKRGLAQLGTLGSGNHFLEVQYVERIDDEGVAQMLGLRLEQIVVLIHCGSRGLGHQVCTDYLRELEESAKHYDYHLPDRQLACVPVHSREGQRYLAAMRASANFAWANRQGITHFARQAFRRIFGPATELRVVYDVCHNIAKLERHQVNGHERLLLVHRKGATRAFPPARPEVPAPYRTAGQPVLIPGSMGTASYVLVGTEGAMKETFGTTCHGAGRLMSRTAAKKSSYAQNARRRLEDQGILVRAETKDGISEEIPEAYKDVDAVVNVVHNAGISRRVARLKPIGVIKG